MSDKIGIGGLYTAVLKAHIQRCIASECSCVVSTECFGDENSFPRYATQGGGVVIDLQEKFYFVEKPNDCPDLEIGDEMPEKWGIVPINEAARAAIEGEEER